MKHSKDKLRSLKRTLRLIGPYRGYLIRMILGGLVVTVLALPVPMLTKVLVDTVYPSSDTDLLIVVILGVASLRIAERWLRAILGFFSQLISFQMERDIHLRFMSHVQTLTLSFIKERQVGDIISRLNDARQSLRGTAGIVSDLFTTASMLLIFPPVLFWLHWKLALIAIAFIPLSALIVGLSNRVIRRITEESATRLAHLTALEVESLSGFHTTKSLGLEGFVFRRIRKAIVHVLDAMHRRSLWYFGANMANSTIAVAGTIVFTYYGWKSILSGGLSLGSFLAFSGLVGYIRTPFNQLLALTQKLQATIVHSDRYLEIMDAQPGLKSGTMRLDLGPDGARLEIESVSFRYADSHMVISNLSLAIESGEVLLITGASGAGKTTLLLLIARLLDPTEGRITLNGIDLRQWHLESIRKHIGLLPQEPFLFQGTVRENILCGSNTDEIAIIRAAQLAGAHEFIKDLPRGYETPVGERGDSLSMGQRQRICLARFLLRNPTIWLLDEPGAAWDAETESRIWNGLLNSRRNRTIVIVSHRSSLFPLADRILELPGGKVSDRPLSSTAP